MAREQRAGSDSPARRTQRTIEETTHLSETIEEFDSQTGQVTRRRVRSEDKDARIIEDVLSGPAVNPGQSTNLKHSAPHHGLPDARSGLIIPDQWKVSIFDSFHDAHLSVADFAGDYLVSRVLGEASEEQIRWELVFIENQGLSRLSVTARVDGRRLLLAVEIDGRLPGPRWTGVVGDDLRQPIRLQRDHTVRPAAFANDDWPGSVVLAALVSSGRRAEPEQPGQIQSGSGYYISPSPADYNRLLGGSGGLSSSAGDEPEPARIPPCEETPGACCPCDCSSAPVRYFNGEVQLTVADLAIEGFGSPWGHQRVYSNQLTPMASTGNGFNWLVEQWPYLIESSDLSSITMVKGTRQTLWFDAVGSDYAGRYGAKSTLAHDAINHKYVLTRPGGEQWLFHDFDQTTYPPGLVSGHISAGGQTTEISSYTAQDQIEEITRSMTVSGQTHTASFLYSYTSDDQLESALYRTRIDTGAWNEIRRVQYEYYGPVDSFGSPTDLKRSRVQVPSSSGWNDTEIRYYRYYTASSSIGFEHGLKFVLNPASYNRMLADSLDPLTASDVQLAGYANFYYEYDSQRRATREIVDAGSRTFTFAYTQSAFSDGYNNWKVKTVETLPDATQNIVYTNYIGQILIKEHKSGSDRWIEYFQFNSDGRETLAATPAAVIDYDDSASDLNVTLRTTVGKIQLTQYYTSSGGGAALGYVQARKIQQGTSGTPITLQAIQYTSRTANDITVYPVSMQTEYRNDDGNSNLTQQTQYVDGSSTRITSFQYDWRDRRTAIDGEVDFFEKQTYDNLNRVIKTERYDTTTSGNLVARSESRFNDRGRVYQSVRYAVDPSTGSVGNSLTDNTWFDAAGNPIKQLPAGSKLFTKTAYDSLGRITAQYQGYDLDETSYADAGTVDGDTIMEQSETTYDSAGNAIEQVIRQRYHNAPASQTGALQSPSLTPNARVTYTAQYADATGRKLASADFGTNGGTAFTRPATVPSRSDTILVTTTAYDNAGEAFSTTDPAGKESRTIRDAMSRTTSQIDNYQASGSGSDENVTTEFTYTADSQIKTLTAKMSSPVTDEVTTYLYGVSSASGSQLTANNLLFATEYPEDTSLKREEYGYNRQGQRIFKEDQNGTVHSYDFDDLGRQTQDRITTLGTDIDSAVRRIETSYDVRGRVDSTTSLDSATVGSGSVLNQIMKQYNDFGQLSTEFIAHSGTVNTSTSPKIQYSYADGSSNQTRPTSVTYPGGREIDFDYGTSGGIDDSLSRVQQLIDGATTLAEYSYLGMGTPVQLSYPQPDVTMDMWDGTSGTYAGLDRFGRTIDLPWIQDPSGTPSDLARIKYGYNRASSPTFARDEVARSNAADLDQLYSYDGLQRLIDFQQGQLNVGNTAISSNTLAQDWGLDQVGNWEGFNQGISGALTQTRTHNRANEITDISNASGQPVWIDPAYDDAGNMTLTPRPDAPTDGFAFTYDGWNRITKVETIDVSPKQVAEYVYDGRNHRITKEVYDAGGTLESTIKFFCSSAWQCLEERETPVVGSSVTTTYVWGRRYIDDLVCRDDGGGRLYAMQDRQYKTIGLTNSSGTVQERYSYTPYGETFFYNSTFTVRTTSAFDWVYLYTGRRLDPESGLYYFRNRYFDPNLGRFSSKDPIAYKGSEWNLFEYVGSSPVRYFDPSGLECFDMLACGPYEPPSSPVDGICGRMATSSDCAGCNSCKQDVQRIRDAIDNVDWTTFFGTNTCQRWLFNFEKELGLLPSGCFNTEVVYWDTKWPGGFPFFGHAAMKITACNGEVFYADKGLGGGDHIFGPDEIPPSYVPPKPIPVVPPSPPSDPFPLPVTPW